MFVKFLRFAYSFVCFYSNCFNQDLGDDDGVAPHAAFFVEAGREVNVIAASSDVPMITDALNDDASARVVRRQTENPLQAFGRRNPSRDDGDLGLEMHRVSQGGDGYYDLSLESEFAL